MSTPLDRLRHHVTGAIERGEAEAIVEQRAPTKWFTIQNQEAGTEEWEDWSSDTDPAALLREFVNAVSSEEIDDVNRYWRVVETAESEED